MNERDLKARTKEYALQIVRLYASLPKTTEAQVLGKQLLRSGTSVGAHYREGQRAKSDADLVHKFESALQELEESGYWLELLAEAGIVKPVQITELCFETEQLLAIFVSVVKRVKQHKQGEK